MLEKLLLTLQVHTMAMGLKLSISILERLINYLQLLDKWNQVHNLSGIKDIKKMLSFHLLDSLSLHPYLTKENNCDVGTGAGLPGIPLAIIFPEQKFTLIESRQKKASFLKQAKLELGLDNVQVMHQRVEMFDPLAKFDMVLSRAFASIYDFLSLTKKLGDDKTQWLAMKGQLMAEELENLPTGYKLIQFFPLQVPEILGARHLVVLTRD